MRQIRISGTEPEELSEAIRFILEHQEYSRNVQEITHIKVKSNHIVAYELTPKHFSGPTYDKKYGKLPLNLDIEGFISTAVKWWQSQPKPDGDPCFDGTIQKGFLVSYGKDYGTLSPDEFGYTADYKNPKDTDVEFDNIHSITIIVNNQYYGK